MLGAAENQAAPKFEIYALLDPDTGAIRYIGKSKNSANRIKQHMRDRNRRRNPVHHWLNRLVENGKAPVLKVLETCEDWVEAERRLIAVSRARGDRLLNIADGGDQPSCDQEVRSRNGKRLSEWLKADPKRMELRRLKILIGSSLRSGAVTNQTRAKLRELARLRPELFGSWALIQDREEP